MTKFSTLLNYHLERVNASAGQLASQLGQLKHPIPRRTIYKWVEGSVQRPRLWQDVVKIARALHLNEGETTQLLQAAGHFSVATLRDIAQAPDRMLLQYWDVPFQEINDLPYFIGREKELKELKQILQRGSQVICSIQGMAGVGKTTLAAHIVHQMRPDFPDGILWAHMNTSSTMSLLDTFARAYGKDVSQLNNLDDRGRVVRDILTRKRALIVLDDAESDKQLKPLLPAAGACAVIITTRQQNLWTLRNAFRFVLQPFNEAHGESLTLFTEILGEESCRKEAESLKQIAQMVGHLPLAVDIIACRLAHQPGWSIPRFLARLQQEKRRLDLLNYNEEVGVRLSLNVSYDALTPNLKAIYKTLGVFGGADFDIDAVSFVSGITSHVIREKLGQLFSLSLIQVGRERRFRLHPLLREYAREKIDDNALYVRMVQYFVDYAASNEFDHVALDQEDSNIEAALQKAWEQGLDVELIRGVQVMYRYWETRGLYETAVFHLGRAKERAKEGDDTHGLAAVLHKIGRLLVRQGRFQQAQTHYTAGLEVAYQKEQGDLICSLQQGLGALAARQGNMADAEKWSESALTLARELGETDRIFDLLTNLGGMTADRGDLVEAKKRYEEALVLAPNVSDHRASKRLGVLLQNLGRVASDMGDTARAEAYYEEAWQLAEAAGDQDRLCGLLDNLGFEAYLSGDYQKAEKDFEKGLKIARRIGSSLFICRHRANQGLMATQYGTYEQADKYYGEALALARDIGATWDICLVLNRWGEMYLLREKWAEAEQLFTKARTQAEMSGFQEHLGRAYFGLAQVAMGQGSWSVAKSHGQASRSIFRKMKHRKLMDIETWQEGQIATGVNK